MAQKNNYTGAYRVDGEVNGVTTALCVGKK